MGLGFSDKLDDLAYPGFDCAFDGLLRLESFLRTFDGGGAGC